MRELSLDDGFFLSEIERTDREALVEHLQAPEISRNTLRIPYPYTEADADDWIDRRLSHRQEQPAAVTFALRNREGLLVGVVGADDLDVGSSHRANIGYWLAKPYWGRGLMTEAVQCYVQYAFKELEIVRLTAEVFSWNDASARVLEKVGFQREGRLRSHREKDGAFVDVLYYGLLQADLS